MVGGLLFASPAFGQAPTTVQLPTFHFFTVQTSVSVPDSGGAYLGGLNRARDGRTSRGFGPFSNRALASDRAASGMSVHATIHDMKAMDEAVLAEAAARRAGVPVDPALGKARLITSSVGRREPALTASTSSPAPIESVAAIRERQATAAQSLSSEAAQYLTQAPQAEADGKPGVAKIYYQMVVRRDNGQLKQLAAARLSALSGKVANVASR
jgi:hypothetical protein